jgi:hypothetical protein
MYERTPEERWLRHKLVMMSWEVSSIDMKLFRLERRLRKLERAWPGETKDRQHELRMERMRIRHELEMLKIDLGSLERRTAPVPKPERLEKQVALASGTQIGTYEIPR